MFILWRGCFETCHKRDGSYVINKRGKCVTNPKIWSFKTPSSKNIQSDIYPDLIIVLDREEYPHFTAYGTRLRFKNGLIKKPPLAGGWRLSNFTKEQLKSMKIEKIGFHFYIATCVHESFHFEGGSARVDFGKMSPYDFFPFSKKLHEYLSSVVIKDYQP